MRAFRVVTASLFLALSALNVGVHFAHGQLLAAFAWIAVVALVATPRLVMHASALGLLNFIVLQWFGVRLQASFDPVAAGFDRETKTWRIRPGRWWSRSAPPPGTRVSWSLLRWVWPLTGWWSDYRWIARRS